MPPIEWKCSCCGSGIRTIMYRIKAYKRRVCRYCLRRVRPVAL